MDYVEQNQLEHSRENLHGEAAIEKIRALVDNTRSCFFCTATAVDGSTGARPMSVQDVDAEGNLWFLSARDSHKDEELTIDPRVRFFFREPITVIFSKSMVMALYPRIGIRLPNFGNRL